MATIAPTRLPVFEDSYRAAADLRTHQFKCVELTAENTVNVTNAATDTCIGVLQNDPNTGEAAHVMHIGRCPVVSDGTVAIAVGDWVGSGPAGKVVKKATAGNPTIGIALQASAADNVVISILLMGPQNFVAAT